MSCSLGKDIQYEHLTPPLELGEGPHWDDAQQALYFVNILAGTIHKHVRATGKNTKTKLDGRVGFIVPVEGTTNQFLVGVARILKIIEWDGEEGSTVRLVRELGTVDQDVKSKSGFNDGKADPRGRLFAGTLAMMSPGNVDRNKGSLYRIDSSGIHKVADGISISNGLAWDLRAKAFYYTDSLEYKIRRYDYDVETGEISNMRYIFDLKEKNIEGMPDGITIDTDGNLWVAIFNGHSVLQINPHTGEILRKITIPNVSQVTSVTFGGPDYATLFVTTARIGNEEKHDKSSGITFAIKSLGVKGLPNVSFSQ